MNDHCQSPYPWDKVVCPILTKPSKDVFVVAELKLRVAGDFPGGDNATLRYTSHVPGHDPKGQACVER